MLTRWTALARRTAHWLVGVMLLAALAPAVSRTLAAQRVEASGSRIELCTGGGVQWVAWPDASGESGASREEAPAHAGLDFCGYCVLAGERFAPLQLDRTDWAAVQGGVPLQEVAPEPQALRWVYQPVARGPPLRG